MAGSVNKAIIIGNLGADPETMRTRDGKLIARLSVATSQSWKDKGSGERRERTEWHRVVIFTEGLAKVAEQYLRKGSKVYVEGQVQTRKWQDRDGNDRYSTEIVLQGYTGILNMLDPRTDQTNRPAPGDNALQYGDGPDSSADPGPTAKDFYDDEIPF